MLANSVHSSLANATMWLEQLLLGQIAYTIAILAIAFTGFTMLQGRLAVRTGLRVLLGCFILFGAPSIAGGLVGLAGAPSGKVAYPTPATDYHGNVVLPDFDPYAGASMPQ